MENINDTVEYHTRATDTFKEVDETSDIIQRKSEIMEEMHKLTEEYNELIGANFFPKQYMIKKLANGTIEIIDSTGIEFES